MDLNIREHLKGYKRLSYVKSDGGTAAFDGGSYIDCALGVNPYGHSKLMDSALEMFDTALLDKYPDFPYIELKRGISRYWKDVAALGDVNIRLGNGSIGILEKLNRVFIDKGSKVLGYCPQFPDYMADVESSGGIYEYTVLQFQNNYRFDADQLLSHMDREHRLIYIDNPNNPTGQVIPVPVIGHIVKEAGRNNICVIVDEAYGDFMDKECSAITLVNEYANLAVVRSFSKGFGLAGARVGYMVTGELISCYYSKVETPFTVSAFGQHMAQLALKDEDFVKDCRKKVSHVKKQIIDACRKVKVLETDVRVPIMVIRHPAEDTDMHGEFARHGVLTEAGEDFVALGKNCVRLRIPTHAQEVADVIRRIERDI